MKDVHLIFLKKDALSFPMENIGCFIDVPQCIAK